MPCKEVYTQGGFAEDAVSQGQRRQSPSPLIGTAHLQRKGHGGSGAPPSWSAFKPVGCGEGQDTRRGKQ